MLHSRYCVDQVNSAGNHPWKLTNINNPLCRYCGHSRESTHQLLTDWLETMLYWMKHGIPLQTLVSNTPSDWFNITLFNCRGFVELGNRTTHPWLLDPCNLLQRYRKNWRARIRVKGIKIWKNCEQAKVPTVIRVV